MQLDSEQRSLFAIRQAYLNLDASNDNSVSDEIPTTAHWTAGLWVLSLFLTLFSAVMGVLAKVWLAKYFPATSIFRSAAEAYARYTLDMQAERWFLGKVLVVIPLLVQIALAAFLAGLAVQSFADSYDIWIALLVLCALGLAVYLGVTVLGCSSLTPFHTTLSELFSKTERLSLIPGPFKSERDGALGHIFYVGLIKSSNSSNVDQAIQELAMYLDDVSFLNTLCENDTVEIILKRIQQCISTKAAGQYEGTKKIGNLTNQMLALLKMLRHYEERFSSGDTADSIFGSQEGQRAREALDTAFRIGHPFHRWTEFPDTLRPLEFALRAHLSPLLKKIRETTDNQPTPKVQTEYEESDARPWDLAKTESLPHRLEIILGACRGLAQADDAQLRITSALFLSVRLAKGETNTTILYNVHGILRLIVHRLQHLLPGRLACGRGGWRTNIVTI